MSISRKFFISALMFLLVGLYVISLGFVGKTSFLNSDAVFYPVTLLVFVGMFFVWKLVYRDIPNLGVKVKAHAKEISKEKWYIKGASVFEGHSTYWLDTKGWRKLENSRKDVEGGVVIKLSSAKVSRQELTIVLWPNHPSIKRIRRISYLDIVEFEFQEQALECALDTELCAWLVLKT